MIPVDQEVKELVHSGDDGRDREPEQQHLIRLVRWSFTALDARDLSSFLTFGTAWLWYGHTARLPSEHQGVQARCRAGSRQPLPWPGQPYASQR